MMGWGWGVLGHRYLTGVDYPNCFLWLSPPESGECVLFVPESPASMVHEVYEGAVPPHEYFRDLSGVERM